MSSDILIRLLSTIFFCNVIFKFVASVWRCGSFVSLRDKTFIKMLYGLLYLGFDRMSIKKVINEKMTNFDVILVSFKLSFFEDTHP